MLWNRYISRYIITEEVRSIGIGKRLLIIESLGFLNLRNIAVITIQYICDILINHATKNSWFPLNYLKMLPP